MGSSPHDLLQAFSNRWTLLASHSIDSERDDAYIPDTYISCDSWFFAPKRDWYKYSFNSQNMDYQCNLIVSIRKIILGKHSYWNITVYYGIGGNNGCLDFGQYTNPRFSPEIEPEHFDAQMLATRLEKQLHKIGKKKIEFYECATFPPLKLFPNCAKDFWLKTGRKCFAQYMSFDTLLDNVIIDDVCPICNTGHTGYICDLRTGEKFPFHSEADPCSICELYHSKYKILVDDFCHIPTNEHTCSGFPKGKTEQKTSVVDYHV